MFHLKFHQGALLALLAVVPASGFALDAAAEKSQIDAQLDQNYKHLDALYKDIHEHPELAFKENSTAAKLAQEMRALGFAVTEHIGKTGIVAIYHNGDGLTVLVRTELDGLPMEEKTGLPYASHAHTQWNGVQTAVAHSCGHDIHMAAWVGTAQALLSMKNQWRGTLMFIGQPAEEVAGGAKAMLDDGLFTRFHKPDYGFALHVTAMPYGRVYYRPGASTSNMDSLDITFKGRGGHGSAPDLTIDPIVEAAHFIVDVQTVVSREKDPAAFGVVTVGALQAGSAGNIIPNEAQLRGTIRTYDQAVQEKLVAGIRRTAAATAEMAGAPSPVVEIGRETAKAIINDPMLTERTGTVFKAAFGSNAVLSPRPGTASEDFSEFIMAGVPSLQFGLGGSDPERVAKAQAGGPPVAGNHSPYFAPVPEPSIRMGVEAMSLAVLNILAR
jgi:hippurate hydrolase